MAQLQCGRPGFDPWVGKIPWRRERLPIPVFWAGEFHGLYSPWGRKELTRLRNFHFHFLLYTFFFLISCKDAKRSAALSFFWVWHGVIRIFLLFSIGLKEVKHHTIFPVTHNSSVQKNPDMDQAPPWPPRFPLLSRG